MFYLFRLIVAVITLQAGYAVSLYDDYDPGNSLYYASLDNLNQQLFSAPLERPNVNLLDLPETAVTAGPINDPEEFEASEKAKELLEEERNKSALLLETLIPIYLGTIMKEVERGDKSWSSQKSVDLSDEAMQPSIQAMVKEQRKDDVSKVDEQARNNNPHRLPGGGEYIDHPLALAGHQFMQGGAGEGRQLLGPDGTFENVQVVKTDNAVPSYCDPPNPCPIGYTAADGCLEKFINSASFSREYQAKQQCSCDNEHSLFNCASPVSTLKSDFYSVQTASSNKQGDLTTPTSTASGGDGEDDIVLNSLDSLNKHKTHYYDLADNRDDEAEAQQSVEGNLNILARTIKNRFGNLESVKNLIADRERELMLRQELDG